ncbi:methyltransferase [Candidatus Woesearchaeota archaeon]|nr:methyltransferase [Candidatus Woesearchaeota archaeon]
MLSKSTLAIRLSKLKTFENPKIHLEQYPTDSEVAASVLHQAYMLGDIEDKRIADYGAGTGILSIGAALMGAQEVQGMEIDEDAIGSANNNATGIPNLRFKHKDALKEEAVFDTIIQNPPFGAQIRKADTPLLAHAISHAPVVYSIHMAKSEAYLREFIRKQGGKITHAWTYEFPLKSSYSFHTKRIKRIEVIVFRIIRAQS